LDLKTKEAYAVDYHSFAGLVNGSSIVRAEYTDSYLQINMSNNLSFVVQADAKDINILLSADPDPYMPSARIRLLAQDEEPFASLINLRLWHVRQLYAILALLDDDRLKDAAGQLKSNPYCDLESLLSADERLRIIGAGQGSFFLDFATKAYDKIKKSPRAALNAIALIFSEGRTLVLRNVKAGTRIREAEAAIKEAEAQKSRLDAMIDAINKIDKIPDKEMRKIMRDAFLENLRKALGPDAEPMLRLLPGKD
jgi:hypothetical protein